jgi:DNA modification methylase
MEIKKVKLNKMKLSDYNPRIHNENYLNNLKRSMDTYGYVEPIVWNKKTGNIVGGHARYKILKEEGIEEIDVVVVNLEEIDEKALNIALNRVTGDWDESLLQPLTIELHDHGINLETLGFELPEIDELINPTPNTVEEDYFEIPETPSNERNIKLGDIFQLGTHRLMCGDSTKAEDVSLLMDGKYINVLVTSPPYFNARTYAQWETFDYYMQDMKKSVQEAINHSEDEFVTCWDICHIRDENGAWDIPSWTSVMMSQLGLEFFERIIWKKSGSVFDCPRSQHIEKGHYFPAYSYEDILVYGKKHPSFNKKDKEKIREWQTNVWEIRQVETNNEENNEGHPAQYPIELPYRCILSYSVEGNIIYEPFAGSGTTAIASEQLNRICYMMEIDPHYCNVILDRWEALTGKQSEKLLP